MLTALFFIGIISTPFKQLLCLIPTRTTSRIRISKAGTKWLCRYWRNSDKNRSWTMTKPVVHSKQPQEMDHEQKKQQRHMDRDKNITEPLFSGQASMPIYQHRGLIGDHHSTHTRARNYESLL